MFSYQDWMDIAWNVCSVYILIICVWSVYRLFRYKGQLRAFSQNEKKVLGLSLFGICIIVGICMGIYNTAFKNIGINEICSNNENLYLEQNGQICDYVELYNKGKWACELEGFWLSDDEHQLNKLSLEEYVIPAGGYIVIGLHGKDGVFELDKKSETVYLSYGSDIKIVDKVLSPKQKKDMAYSRNEESTNQWALMRCTPGKKNNIKSTMISEPNFSHESGFYEKSFWLELMSEPGDEIYYTLDGSIPTEESNRYKGPIWIYDKSEEENVYRSTINVIKNWKDYQPDKTPVDKAFIIRAVTIGENGKCSDIVTKTYFIDLNQYKDDNVISLVMDPEELFGEDGIYVTGKEYDNWYTTGQVGDRPLANFENTYEKEAVLEMFEGESIFAQNVGVRINGGSSRDAIWKRFSIFARKEYSGDNTFDREIFQLKDTHSIVLRNVFGDVLSQELAEGRSVDTQDAKPAVLFLNGEYWYDTYMVEKYNRTYIEVEYGIDNDNVILAKNRVVSDPLDGDQELLDAVYTYLDNHPFTTEEEYAEFSELVDMQSYIDFICINAYLCNMDVDEQKNVMMWRVRETEDNVYADGKWRWMLYDMDSIEWDDAERYGVENNAMIDTFTMRPPYTTGSYEEQYMYRNVRRIPSFCKQFVLTFMDLVNTNFTIENVTKKLAEYGEDITWNDSFFLQREQYIVPYMAQEFDLTGTIEEVQLSVNNVDYGSIKLNTITPDLSDGKWSGKYFTDYPITVTAIPKPGYEFIGWTGDIESLDETIEVDVIAGGIQIHAEYQKKEN